MDGRYKMLSDKIINDLKARVISSKHHPFVIGIAGNSRSGKTTLARKLKDSFEKLNKKVFIVELDNWIKPKNERLESENVFGRFQLDVLSKDVEGIITGESVSKGYDIIIVEGVVALSSEQLRNLYDHKLFIDIDYSTQEKRVRELYTQRKYEQKEIDQIIKTRLDDEFVLIDKDRVFANCVVEGLS